jgi:hypothetical protein
MAQMDIPDELTDELVSEVMDATRPERRTGDQGRAWELMSAKPYLLASETVGSEPPPRVSRGFRAGSAQFLFGS